MRYENAKSPFAVFSVLMLMVELLTLHISTVYAMGPDGEDKIPPQKMEDIKQGKNTVESVLNDPAKFAGKEIILEGAFRGWKGKCPGSIAITRSDWILEDQTGCIYVSGKLPGNLSVARPQGERLVVRGVVKHDNIGGTIFLKAVDVKELPSTSGQ